jgi:hypothetical protein
MQELKEASRSKADSGIDLEPSEINIYSWKAYIRVNIPQSPGLMCYARPLLSARMTALKYTRADSSHMQTEHLYKVSSFMNILFRSPGSLTSTRACWQLGILCQSILALWIAAEW